jgi:hypothetical protein
MIINRGVSWMANNKMLEELDTQIENLKKQREAVVAKEKADDLRKVKYLLKTHRFTYSQVKKELGVGRATKKCQMCGSVAAG